MSLLNTVIKSTVNKYNPSIIGVTGAINKSLIIGALSKLFSERSQPFIAMPNVDHSIRSMQRTLLGFSIGKNGFVLFIRSLLRFIFGGRYPRNIIVEYPLLGHTDIKSRLSITKPETLIVGGLGDFPPSVELYPDKEAMIKDVRNMVEGINHKGAVILNSDDEALMSIKNDANGTGEIRAKVITFGFDGSADVRITGFENRVEDGKPVGISFKLEHNGSFVPIKMDGIFGHFYAYAVAAAVALAVSQGVNLVRASELIALYQGERGRGRLVPGIKDTTIIDETYDSSLDGAINALKILRDIPATRKIAVLGDIIGVGEYTEAVHKELGKLSTDIADILITVGPRAKFIADEARAVAKDKGAKGNSIKVLDFEESDKAKIELQTIMKPNDLVLVKGSRFMEMERVVLEVMAEPQRAKDVLVQRPKININGH